MQPLLSHILFNIEPANTGFYRDLLTFLGWHVLYDGEGMLGMGGAAETSLWFGAQAKGTPNDYDGPGMNHIGLGVAAQADVDAAATYLTKHGMTMLFETPRHRPDFSAGPEHTYYQIMFESPDRILIEVVYTGPKSA